MKILSLANVPLDHSLGSGKIILSWTDGLRELGHDVTVISIYDYYQPLPYGLLHRFKICHDTKKFEDLIRSDNYDIVEFYGAEWGNLIHLISIQQRHERPLLIHHSNGCELLMNSVHKEPLSKNYKFTPVYLASRLLDSYLLRINRKAFSSADYFCSICSQDIDYLVRNQLSTHSNSAVIEPGIDSFYIDSCWNRPKKQWVTFVGSWLNRKGKSAVVKVISELFLRFHDLEFHVVGSFDNQSDLLSSFDSAFHERIRVYKPLLRLDEILTQSKILLFPSLYESFGLATVEAMACGCTVVATPTGYASTISSNQDGVLCEFNDHTSMINECSKLLCDDDLRSKICLQAREKVKAMSWKRQVKLLEARYLTWLSSM